MAPPDVDGVRPSRLRKIPEHEMCIRPRLARLTESSRVVALCIQVMYDSGDPSAFTHSIADPNHWDSEDDHEIVTAAGCANRIPPSNSPDPSADGEV